jgi:hypothetical protein
MVKRSGAFVLTRLYLVTVMGFAVNLHFCGSYLAAVKIDAPVKSCIMMSGKMKCCTNKHFVVKVKDAHQGEVHSFLSKIFAFELAKLPFNDSFLQVSAVTSIKFFDRGPPDISSGSISIFLKNCTFRI